MRIGFGSTMIENAVSQGQLDGIGYYTQCLINEFKKNQQHVVPCSFPPLKKWRFHSSLPNGKSFNLPYMTSTAFSLVTPRSASLHKKIEKNIDIFHAPDHLVPRFKKTPVVATLHDALLLLHPEWYQARFMRFKNWIRKKSTLWADHFITGSHSMIKELVEHWGVPEDKISVVYDGLANTWSERVSVETKQHVLNKYHLPEKFILVVGTLQPKKNVPRVIHAFLQLPKDIREEFPLVIVGKAGWNTEESLSAIENLIMNKTGHWLKYLPQEDLQVLFQAATLYVHMSLHEGFGLTLVQAFASGAPVLTSTVTAMPETAGGAAYLADPYNEDEINQAMKKLLLDENLRAELVAKGLVRAKDFSWEKCARETLAVYNAVLMRGIHASST